MEIQNAPDFWPKKFTSKRKYVNCHFLCTFRDMSLFCYSHNTCGAMHYRSPTKEFIYKSQEPKVTKEIKVNGNYLPNYSNDGNP